MSAALPPSGRQPKRSLFRAGCGTLLPDGPPRALIPVPLVPSDEGHRPFQLNRNPVEGDHIT
ncbi:protein of unknown function [Microbacterium sp. Nx66]|nr:protein of unknown function [Microbacterium sp. Nx66]